MFSPDSEYGHKEPNPFEDDGFVTGSIVLPGLDMSLNLSEKHYFRFDGIVQNMQEHLRSLSPDIRAFLDKYIEDPRMQTAFNFGLIWYDFIGMFMAVRDVSPRVNLSNIAHEAAEIVFGLGYQKELETHLRGFGLEKGINDFETHEIGVIAGILIPRAKGMDMTKLYDEQDQFIYRDLLNRGYY